METEQAPKTYTEREVAGIVRKAIRQDREFFAQVLRGTPDLDATTKQGWIENPKAVPAVLKGFLPVIIDCDANPSCPEGWTVVKHKRGGQFRWSKDAACLYFSLSQQGGKMIEGNSLRRELAKKPVLNANVLDYLLKRPHLTFDEWKIVHIGFWGTIYRDDLGRLGIRCFYWDFTQGREVFQCLDDYFGRGFPAALRAA